jgi:hypothetical protein
MIKTWLTKLIRNRNLSIEFLCWDTWSNGHFLSLNTFYSKSLSVLVYFLFLHIFCPWTFFVLGHFLSLDTFCHWSFFVLGHFLSLDTFCPRTLFVLGQFLSLDTFCPWTLSTLGCFLAWNSVTTLYSLKLSGLVHFLSFFGSTYFFNILSMSH